MASHRWCVSGTPIGRGRLEDLYGLILFLNFKPFDEQKWFRNTFDLQVRDALNRLSYLLRDIMWRSTKANAAVREQMGIPEQEEVKVLLKFSSIEKHFYERQYQETMGAAQCIIASGNASASDSKTKDLSALSQLLQKLRAACCHPQVGASGIGRLRAHGRGQTVAERVLSMEQILQKLIDDAKSQCEEAQRIVTLHTNGMACLTRLKAERLRRRI